VDPLSIELLAPLGFGSAVGGIAMGLADELQEAGVTVVLA
jgi:hypothetical protein